LHGKRNYELEKMKTSISNYWHTTEWQRVWWCLFL